MDLVILIGLQASGKSTFVRTRLAETHVHVSKDLIGHKKNTAKRQQELIETALLAGKSVVVDNTNPTAADRQTLITLARAHGARVVGYYFESSVPECRARNQAREGTARVPDVAIYTTIKRLERPARGEGFDELFHARIVESGFEVTAWIEEEEADEAR
jgi:predicted kinase